MHRESRVCPRCNGQLAQDNQDNDALNCIQCGNLLYDDPPAPYTTDRRSRTDNRQTNKPFDEYRQGMGPDEFEEAFGEIIEGTP